MVKKIPRRLRTGGGLDGWILWADSPLRRDLAYDAYDYDDA